MPIGDINAHVGGIIALLIEPLYDPRRDGREIPLAREQRRLAAIVAADVVGYSRLMGRDESGTLARLREHRKERFEPMLGRHGGRLVKLTGDGALAEFPSAVDALGAAIEFQQAMAEANKDQPEDMRIVFRVGLHLGDLIVDGDDLYGDGVNIAVRLEAEAPAGGIVISGDVHNAVAGRLKAAFVDLGNLSLKNIERPVRAFRADVDGVAGASAEAALPNSAGRPRLLPDKPSILVLPFLCPGGTAEDEALAEGITESLITDLSRQSELSVVAQDMSPAVGGKLLDVRELGRTMGVRYVLQGRLLLGPGRLRVNVQLISANDGIHIWADRFDKKLGDLLDLEDEIAERISRAVVVPLREAEIRRAHRASGSSYDAETLVRLGRRAFLQGFCRKNCEQAAALYAEAIVADDRNAYAYTSLSIAKALLNLLNWSDTVKAELDLAIRHRDRAQAIDPNFPPGLVATAYILVAERKFAAALAAFERVARSAPLAGGNAFANVAVATNNVGRSAEAEVELLRVIRVTPGDPQMEVWYYDLGITYSYLGQYAKAADAFGKAISINPEFDSPYICFAAACVQLGRLAEASAAIQQAWTLGTLWTIRTVKAAAHSGIGVGVDDVRMTALWDGLRLAGLPE